jgi:predicted acetyltransferase
MPELEFRQIEGEDIVDLALAMTTFAFGPSPREFQREEMLKRLPYLTGRYYLGLFDGDTLVSTANSVPFTQNVRGKIFPMGGFEGAVTHPNHRRKGYMTQTMRHLFEIMHDMDYAFSALYPFRESFYERAGYLSFPHLRLVEIQALPLAPLLKQDMVGDVQMVSMKEGFDDYRALQKAVFPHMHGMALRDDQAAEITRQFVQLWLGIAKVDGEVVGAIAYKIEGYMKRMDVRRFFYKNGTGKYLLLRYLAQHIDQVRSISILNHPADLIETWYPDLEVEMKTQAIRLDTFTYPMARVFNVNLIGGMAVGRGQFTAQIEDKLCPWNNGTFTFASVDGVLEVKPVSSTRADCTLTINALTSLCYGLHDPSDFYPRGWGNPDVDTQTIMRSMFSRQIPFLHEDF